MISRRPTKADAAKLAEALKPTARAPDPYGALEYLLAAILAPEPQKMSGRPRTRTPEHDRRLLGLFEQLKAVEQRALGRDPTDRECIESLARTLKRQKRELVVKPKTILNILSEARQRARRADAP
jgi:hypothetical protein